MDGLLLVDKPAGWSSHDAVAYIRRALGEKRAGHTGTLDPDATGLLLVLVGKATRLARYFEKDDKKYLAVMRLGAETDTEDAQGRITRECPVPELAPGQVEALFGRFTGEIEQTPPMYSAVKLDGRPLYKHARAGRELTRKTRRVTLHGLRLLGLEGPMVSFEARCSKGTYIRTLCKDMGEALGSCAHLQSLRRSGAGRYGVEDAVSLDGRPSKEILAAGLIGMRDILPDMPAATVSEAAVKGIRDGRRPGKQEITGMTGWPAPGGDVKVVDGSGGLVAMAEFTSDADFPLAPRVVLV